MRAAFALLLAASSGYLGWRFRENYEAARGRFTRTEGER